MVVFSGTSWGLSMRLYEIILSVVPQFVKGKKGLWGMYRTGNRLVFNPTYSWGHHLIYIFFGRGEGGI